MTYEQLVAAIGRGFHPDISGDQYASLPEGVTPADVDRIVASAFEDDEAGTHLDPYSRAIEVLEPLGLRVLD